MNWIDTAIVKLIGKYLDGDLNKWGISKTKAVAWIAFALTVAPKIGADLGHPFTIPPDVFKILGALGLWALKDGQNAAVISQANGGGK